MPTPLQIPASIDARTVLRADDKVPVAWQAELHFEGWG